MTLYEIDENITALINDDGEITDLEAFDALQISRNEKIESIGCYIKNLTSDAVAIKAEEEALSARRKAIENKVKGLRMLLMNSLNGEKFSSPKVSISYRTSKSLEIVDDEVFTSWAAMHMPGLIRHKIEPDKKAITDMINGGYDVPMAQIVEKRNLQVK